jgi:DNA primase
MMTTSWVDFETIKRTVSLEMVLNHYRIELRSGGPGTLRGKCPLPMHGSKESRASFTATLTKGVGGVWACQSASCIKGRDGKRGGNALDFVATMEDCSIREAAEKMSEWFGIARTGMPTARATSNTAPQSVSKENGNSGAKVNKPLGFALQGVEFKHPYLEGRGVDEATARKFGIGYFPGRGTMQKRVVIPIHNGNGELVAYAGRAIDDREPKYKLPLGFQKGIELFNLNRVLADDKAPRYVVVVEGFFDCVAVTTAGFPCVALMGCSMSETQEELLVKHFTRVCVLLDGDEAGRRATDDVLRRLARRLWVHASILPDGIQPDTLSIDQIRAAIW